MKYFNCADNLAINGVPKRTKLSHQYESKSERVKGSESVFTWSDTITIESISLWNFLSLSPRLVQNFFRFPRRPEPPTPLLVHFRPRCDSVDREEEQFLWFDHGEQVRDVGEYGEKDLFFRDSERGVVVVWMRTVVDDSIHVEIYFAVGE